MAKSMSTNGNADTPAFRALEEAIELNIQGCSPYPDRAYFVDADVPNLSELIARATDEGKDVVLVWPDGKTRILRTEALAHQPS